MGDSTIRPVPVAVIGAGPTGITAATLLAQYGVECLILDRWPTVYPQPRAVHMDDEVCRHLPPAPGAAEWLRLVPVDFETDSWWDRLLANGFDPNAPVVVASLGVSMYLTRDATEATLRQIATLSPGSTLAMTYLLPVELVEPEEQAMHRATDAAARASGTPFISYYSPEEILAMARDAGFATVRHVTAADYTRRYFVERTDGLRPFTTEELLVATT